MSDDRKLPTKATQSLPATTENLYPVRPKSGFSAWLTRFQIEANYLTEVENNKLLREYEERYQIIGRVVDARLMLEEKLAIYGKRDQIIAARLQALDTNLEFEAIGRQTQLRKAQDALRVSQEAADEAKAQHKARMDLIEEQRKADIARVQLGEVKNQTNIQFELATRPARIKKGIHTIETNEIVERGNRVEAEAVYRKRVAGLGDAGEDTDNDPMRALSQMVVEKQQEWERAVQAHKSAEIIALLSEQLLHLKARLEAERDGY